MFWRGNKLNPHTQALSLYLQNLCYKLSLQFTKRPNCSYKYFYKLAIYYVKKKKKKPNTISFHLNELMFNLLLLKF